MKLQLDHSAWFFFAITVLFWALSVGWVRNRHLGEQLNWTRVLVSFFGFVWVGFGVDFILRFLVVFYDPEYFLATTYPLWRLPAGTFSQVWLSLAAFWASFCAAFVATVVWLPRTTQGKFTLIKEFISLRNLILFDIIAIFCTVLIIAVNCFVIPRAILTPMGRIAFLYLLPLCAAWFLYFRGDPIGARRFIYCIPGILHYILNPYREVMLVNIFCILLPALQLRRVTSWYKLALGMLLFLIVSTQITEIYRAYFWENYGYYYQEKLAAQWENWQQTPSTAPWVRLLNRFHGFDSVALTTFFVPDVMPYSDRPLLQEMLVRALIPRLIFGSKSDLQGGREFSRSIWAFDTRGKSLDIDAMIAPSLPGHLYSVYGLPSLIIGALCVGLLVGLLENWGRGLGTEAGCLFLVLFGLQVVGALERDFNNGLVLSCINKRYD